MKLLEKFDKEFLVAISILVICTISLFALVVIFVMYFDKDPMSASNLTDIKYAKEGYNVYAIVITDYINLREDPNTDYDPIGIVHKDEVYQVIDIINIDKQFKWYKVKDSEGNTGYLSYSRGKYLDIKYGKEEEITLSTFTTYETKPKVEQLVKTTTTTTTTTTKKTKKGNTSTFSKATAGTTTTTNLTDNN